MLAVRHLKQIGPYVVGQIHGYLERERMQQEIQDTARQWHVLLIEPQHETRAQLYLVAYRFKVYMPTLPHRTTRGVRRRKVEVERPMFPGYMFIRYNPELDDGKRRLRIDIAPGVREFLKLEGAHAIISDADLEQVHREEQYQRTRRAEVRFGYGHGEMVRVSEGPFRGLNGTIDQLDDQGRIKVLLSLLGRATPVAMQVEDIEKL